MAAPATLRIPQTIQSTIERFTQLSKEPLSDHRECNDLAGRISAYFLDLFNNLTENAAQPGNTHSYSLLIEALEMYSGLQALFDPRIVKSIAHLQPQEVERTLQQAIENEPEEAKKTVLQQRHQRILAQLAVANGRTLQYQNHVKHALVQFQDAVKTDSKNPELHYHISRALHDLKRDEEALLACIEAEAGDKTPKYRKLHARILFDLGQYDELLQNYRDDDDYLTRTIHESGLAFRAAFHNLGLKNYERARDGFSSILERLPKYFDALHCLRQARSSTEVMVTKLIKAGKIPLTEPNKPLYEDMVLQLIPALLRVPTQNNYEGALKLMIIAAENGVATEMLSVCLNHLNLNSVTQLTCAGTVFLHPNTPDWIKSNWHEFLKQRILIQAENFLGVANGVWETNPVFAQQALQSTRELYNVLVTVENEDVRIVTLRHDIETAHRRIQDIEDKVLAFSNKVLKDIFNKGKSFSPQYADILSEVIRSHLVQHPSYCDNEELLDHLQKQITIVTLSPLSVLRINKTLTPSLSIDLFRSSLIDTFSQYPPKYVVFPPHEEEGAPQHVAAARHGHTTSSAPSAPQSEGKEDSA